MVLPGHDIFSDFLGNPGDGRSVNFKIINFPDLLFNIAIAHSFCVERYDDVYYTIDILRLGTIIGLKEALRSLGTWIWDSPKEVRTFFDQNHCGYWDCQTSGFYHTLNGYPIRLPAFSQCHVFCSCFKKPLSSSPLLNCFKNLSLNKSSSFILCKI